MIGYLSQHELKNFKQTSRRNAIICLEEMEKFHVSVFNMNEMVNSQMRSYYENFCDIPSSLKTIRVNKLRTVVDLRDEWCKKYKINNDNLLLYPLEMQYLSEK